MTINQPSGAERMGRTVASAIHEHWVLFLIEGIVLVILGIVAILVPLIATLAFTILIGWLFLISGIVGLITTIWARHAPGFWWSLISALIGILAGLALLASPVTGALSLTLVLIAFFIIEGVASIMYAVDHRRQLTGSWVWMLLSGIIDIILAGIILLGLPETAVWALGLLVGINMLFGGAATDRDGVRGEAAGLKLSTPLVPAKAGTQLLFARPLLDSRVRGNERPDYSAGTGCGTRVFSTPLAITAMKTTATNSASATAAVTPRTRSNPPRPYRMAIIDTATPETMKVKK